MPNSVASRGGHSCNSCVCPGTMSSNGPACATRPSLRLGACRVCPKKSIREPPAVDVPPAVDRPASIVSRSPSGLVQLYLAPGPHTPTSSADTALHTFSPETSAVMDNSPSWLVLLTALCVIVLLQQPEQLLVRVAWGPTKMLPSTQ